MIKNPAREIRILKIRWLGDEIESPTVVYRSAPWFLKGWAGSLGGKASANADSWLEDSGGSDAGRGD